MAFGKVIYSNFINRGATTVVKSVGTLNWWWWQNTTEGFVHC